MSAITPFLEQQDDPAITEVMREEFDVPAPISAAQQGTLEDRGGALVRSLQGLGAPSEADVFAMGELSAAVMDGTHSGLLTTAWIRHAVMEALVGRSYQVVADGDDVKIVLDGPIVPGWEEGETVAAWSPPASLNATRFSVLSWTSKMGAPSFSLPAGPEEALGSCPGAAAGQSIVPLNKLLKTAKLVQAVTHRPVRLQQAVCQMCYAEGGQYSTGQVQYAQMLRYLWSQAAANAVRGTFERGYRFDEPLAASWLDAMHYAIEHADYLGEGGKVNKVVYPPERHPGRYFRVHDSGDFFSARYLALWRELARRSPGITFWAPSRAWATSWGIEAVKALNAPPSNLVIRPSAYNINEAPPQDLGTGWAKGSSAYSLAVKHERIQRGVGRSIGYDYDCQTYAVDDEKHTCRHAEAPDGKIGCRACWRFGQELRINYTLHGRETETGAELDEDEGEG